ncbi:MAG: glycosyltransferase, partial [Pseudomonadota bacterium]
VEKAFATLGDRVAFHGARDRGDVARMIADADAFVWPGIGEAFGMVYLEAQALGVPVVAIDTAGVSNVVVHDRTGLLAALVSPEAYAGAIRRMIEDGGTRARLGAGAAAFVSEERGLAQAAQTLTSALTRAMAGSASHDST